MTKKIITAATLFAASSALASAASVVYTFNLTTTIPEATVNISCNDGRTSYEQGMTGLGDNAKFSVSGGGQQWMMATDNNRNPFDDITTLANNTYAQGIFSNAGIASSSISSITQGVGDGSGTPATTNYAFTGLTSNTTYMVTLIVGGSKGGGSGVGKISWDTGTLVSGKYAYGESAQTTIASTETQLVLSSLSAIELLLTTDSSGTFNIKLYNHSGDNYGSKTGLGLLAVSSVPEPSAFGLLAGIGALALAVSRRRRSR